MSNTDYPDMATIARVVRKKVRSLLGVYSLLIIGTILGFLIITLVFVFIYFGFDVDVWFKRIALVVFLVACSCVSLILRPLFRMFKRPKEKGRKIYRKDYPEFFSMLDDVVAQVQCLPPKQVRVSDECNAYAYYNSLLGYLISGRQNLTIGLPLLYGMNKTELKSILSHEFGHFAQRTIATNSIANLSEFVCASIARAQEDIDKEEATSFKRYARWFAGFVGKIMARQYYKIAPYNSILSRAQEYDADHYSQLVVGTEGAISALCKLEHVSKRWNDFYGIMISFQRDEKRAPDDVLSVFSEYCAQMDKENGVNISSSIHFAEVKKDASSRLGYANNFDTHPSHEKRIEAIASYPFVPTVWNDTPAFSFWGTDIVSSVFNETVWDIKQLLDPGAIVLARKKDITAQEVKSYFENSTPMYLDSFFNYPILIAPQIVGASVNCTFSPFTKENAELFSEYYVAIQDMEILERINQEHSPERRFRYLDDIYDGCNVPIKRHGSYLAPLEDKAIKIAAQCASWLDIMAETKGYMNDLSLYRKISSVYLSLQDLFGAVNQLSEMIKVRDSYKPHITLPFSFPLVPINAYLKETMDMISISEELDGNSEVVVKMENNFVSLTRDCFVTDSDGRMMFMDICSDLGVDEEQQSLTLSYIRREKKDKRDFVNAFFTVYYTVEAYSRKSWDKLVRVLLMDDKNL